MKQASKLFFGKGNAKLGKTIHTFSLPAGHSCPFADECLSKADKTTGKVKDGPRMKFRCFAASQETMWTSVRNSRWHNYNLLRKLQLPAMARLIQESLPAKAEIIRVHVSGDFFTSVYFKAWMEVAGDNPNIIFYAYTKCTSYMVKYKDLVPENFILTASYGGRNDHLIVEHKLKSAKVVFSEKEAKDLNLEIDHDDSHAYNGMKSFALLLHGMQPKDSPAATALKEMNKAGIKYSYGTA